MGCFRTRSPRTIALASDVRDCCPHEQEHPGHGAVSAHQGRASRYPALLSDGRFLRAVLRRRPPRLEAARHRAHLPRAVGRRPDPDGGGAGAFGRVVSREARAQGGIGRGLRTDRRSGGVARPGRAAGHPHHHPGDADRRIPARGSPRQRARRGPLRRGTLGHRGVGALERQIHLHRGRRHGERSSRDRTARSGRGPPLRGRAGARLCARAPGAAADRAVAFRPGIGPANPHRAARDPRSLTVRARGSSARGRRSRRADRLRPRYAMRLAPARDHGALRAS